MKMKAGARLGPYEVVAPLGAGGMGEVWKAVDTRLGREVALKVLASGVAADPDRLARFEREARAISALRHPHVCSLYDVGEQDGVGFLVMEHVPGETLAERLKRGAIALENALDIARQIAEGLEAAHEKGIVHRDLKPANVKLLPDGSVRILDFGLAKAVEGDRGSGSGALDDSPTLSRHATEAGLILGTAAYMSPEQARGRAVDRRTDVWAFGVLLYEMLTGRRLFTGETVSDVLAAVLRQEPDWAALPPAMPPALSRLLRMCLERDAKHRLHDIADARVEIEQVLREPQGAAGAGAAGRTRRPPARWTIAVPCLAAGAALGVVATLTLAHRRPSPQRVRAALVLPQDLRLELSGFSAGTAVVSPDGRRVVFGARRGGERTMLYVRALDDPDPKPLPGTEGGRRPFWSPDGRSLGFFTETHLKRIALDGGPPLGLARARDARGGTWSRQGMIVFAPNAEGALFAVAEGGGEPKPVTVLQPGEVTHRYPFFLPDGRRFAYLARSRAAGAGRAPRLVVGSLDSAETTVLLEAASNPVVAGGRLLFVRDGALFVQRLDLARAAVQGQAHPVVDNVLTNNRFSFAAFSASEDVLVYQTGRQADLSQYVWVDRTGRQREAVGEGGVHTGSAGVDISPDGRLVAVSRVDPDTGEGDIWIYDLRGGNRRRLSAPGSDEGNPVFTPDGRAVVFDKESYVGDDERLVLQPLDGGAPRALLRGAGERHSPVSFSPDGRLLVLAPWDRLAGGKLALLSLAEGGEPRPLLGSNAWERFGQVSPDGRWLAYASDESGRFEVYLTTFPRPGTRWQVSRDGGTEPRWRGDGGELFLFAADNVLQAVPVTVQGGAISFGAPQRLFPVAEHWVWRYAVSRDGQSFLVRLPLEEREASPITVDIGWQRSLEEG